MGARLKEKAHEGGVQTALEHGNVLGAQKRLGEMSRLQGLVSALDKCKMSVIAWFHAMKSNNACWLPADTHETCQSASIKEDVFCI